MLLDDIKQHILTKTGKVNTSIIRREWFRASKLYRDILDATSFLPADRSISERVFCIRENITHLPICSITKQPLKFLPSIKRYAFVSGRENSKHVINFKERNKKISFNKKENIKDINKSLLRRYRDSHYTLLSRETVEEFVDKKIRDTDTGRLSNFINVKDKNTHSNILCSLLHYTEHYLLEFENLKNVNWSERFYLLKYKIEPPLCSSNNGKKATFGNFIIGYRKNSSNKERIKQLTKNIIENIEQQNFTVLSEDISCLKNTTFTLQCNVCKKVHKKTLTNARWKDIYCSGCYRDVGVSREEKVICTFIESLGFNIIENDTTILNGKELDILVPQKQLAIEYNGILWHSFGTTYPNNSYLESANKKSHLNKTALCLEKNIQLLHIFENEWLQKRPIIESVIKSKLGVIDRKIYARNCHIKALDNFTKEQFLVTNHIQGDCASKINLGLYYKDELVAVMTFGARKITSKAPEMELLRFCNVLNTITVGGASKLFQFFIKTYTPKKVISYADRRYSNGNLYDTLGFTLSHCSSPNYWYTNDTVNLFHRVKFQKHKICDESSKHLTETRIMYNNGYRKIYDCGSFVYTYTP